MSEVSAAPSCLMAAQYLGYMVEDFSCHEEAVTRYIRYSVEDVMF